MSQHPYQGLPRSSFWRRAVADIAIANLDPVIDVDFRITSSHKIVTAGSCFAQHIARHLRDSGFNFLVTEGPHPIVSRGVADEYNYGVYTARYGNIYTSRQLLQLFQRAYGAFTPAEDCWQEADGSLIDPFRPQIQPHGFLSRAEYQADRRQHFACVRRAIETVDLFVFTLGLTECWRSREDGAVFPLCPGVAGGRFDPQKHEFLNLTVAEIVADMLLFADKLREVNKRARILLTVSPVPLIATMEHRHVLSATTYSKSVLRVAAEELIRSRDFISYFPSYEIITGGYNRGAYFAADCRSVTEDGVSHVMRTFMRHYTDSETLPAAVEQPQERQFEREMERLVRVVCEEQALDSIG